MQLSRSMMLAAVAVVASASSAWSQEIYRVRGTVEKTDEAAMTVKDRAGKDVVLKLPATFPVRGIVKQQLSDIKPNSYIGIASMPQPDGSLKALEVHIFPENMRGTGEGHRDWDLVPKSLMTNAAVENMVTGVDGQTISLKYKDGDKKILVGPTTPIVTYVPGDKAELKPGVKIIAQVKKLPDGSGEIVNVSAGRDGLTPPM